MKMTTRAWMPGFGFGSILLLVMPSASLAQSASAGCGTAALTSGLYQMDDRGITRSYHLHVPSSYSSDTPTPVVAMFHGWGGDESAFVGNASVTALADERGYILVSPRGLGSGGGDDSYNSWTFPGSSSGLDGDGGAICDFEVTGNYGYPSCNVAGAEVAQNTCSWTHCQTDDFDFAVELIDKIKSDLCVDPDRVFAMGGSNGGMFTWALGQDERTAPLFRAIAPLMGLPHRGYLDGPATNGLPVMVITGSQDPTVPPGEWEDTSFTTTTDGDVYFYTGASAITQVWASEAGCAMDQPAMSVAVALPEVDCRSYCKAVGEKMPAVMDCRIDMDHSDYRLETTWPLMVDFFDAQASK